MASAPAPDEEVLEEEDPVASTTDEPLQAAAATKDAKERARKNRWFMSGRAMAPSRRFNQKGF
jgi:hypothetical protein